MSVEITKAMVGAGAMTEPPHASFTPFGCPSGERTFSIQRHFWDDCPTTRQREEINMPRNPGELARLEDEYEYWCGKAYNLILGKSSREYALGRVRELEKQLGIDSKKYNGG